MNNGSICLLLCLIGIGASTASASEAYDRPALSLDGTWEFLMDPGSIGEKESWHSSGKEFPSRIQVPGAWDAQGFGEENEKLRNNYVGKAWYRKRIAIPENWSGKQVFLRFGGVYRSARVWVNGEEIGYHLGYVSEFEFDITSLVIPGQESEVVVLVDSEQRWEEDALQGCMDIIDHFFTSWGGIWSHVSLEARASAWSTDVFVQPSVSPKGCLVSGKLAGSTGEVDRIHAFVCDNEGELLNEVIYHPEKEDEFAIDIALPDAELWTPDSPTLYTLTVAFHAADGSVLDQVAERFGVRTIAIDGTDFLVNGEKFYLVGYGDDCVYPETIAPPADKSYYIERLKAAKAYGFNFVRHHSHFVAPEYYEACDEVGMLVSPELPIAYPRFYERAHGKALDLYRQEWSGAISRYRNHPSIFNWSMSNELWGGMPRIGDDLYEIAKTLDPTRPVIDSDGLFQPGFDDGTKDRSTLDFLTIMFDILTTPLDNPEKFKTGTPLKPVVSHETGNYIHFPRLDEIALYTDNFKPFWLEDCLARVEQAGLAEESAAWSLASQQLYVQSHKLNLEALRKNPMISGYHWWLFQPWYCGSNGLVDIHRRPISVAPVEIRKFNAPLVLLQDGLEQTYRSGEPIAIEVLVSNYAGGEVSSGTVRYTLESDGMAITKGDFGTKVVGNGTVATLGSVALEAPEVDSPVKATLKVALESGERRVENGWPVWIYPSKQPKVSEETPLYASADLHALLNPFKVRPFPESSPLPADATYVVRQLSSEVLEAVDRGATALLHAPAGLYPVDWTTYKPAWWLGVFEGDSNAGTYVYKNPVTDGLTPDGWCDASWFHLLQGAQTPLLESFPTQPEVFIRALNSHGAPHPFSRYADFEYTWRNKALLAQVSVGKGAMILSGMNFDVAARNGGAEVAFILNRLLEHARSRPEPEEVWSVAFVENLLSDSHFDTKSLVSGFDHLLYHKGEDAEGQSYRDAKTPVLRIRQERPEHRLTWMSAPIEDPNEAVLVFAGGFPFLAPPSGHPGFTLAVNGEALLHFDTSKTLAQWESPNGDAALLYVPSNLRPSWGETVGLFYLSLPADKWRGGEAVELEVRSRGSENTRYFGLHPYDDILDGNPWRAIPALAE